MKLKIVDMEKINAQIEAMEAIKNLAIGGAETARNCAACSHCIDAATGDEFLHLATSFERIAELAGSSPDRGDAKEGE